MNDIHTSQLLKSIEEQYRDPNQFSWKSRRDEKLNPLVYMQNIHQLLLKNNVIPEVGKTCTVLFVADNNGSHSAAFFDIDKKYREGKGGTYVLAGDLVKLEQVKQNYKDPTSAYTYMQFNALDMSNQQLPLTNFDLLFDVKGALWFLSRMDNTEIAKQQVTEVFAEYYKQLKPGGYIVLDAIEEWFADAGYQEEPSTFDAFLELGLIKDGVINEELFPEVAKQFRVMPVVGEEESKIFFMQKI